MYYLRIVVSEWKYNIVTKYLHYVNVIINFKMYNT